MSWPRGSNIQAGADPVELGQKVRTLLDHVRAFKARPSSGNESNRVATGVAVYALERVVCHFDGSNKLA